MINKKKIGLFPGSFDPMHQGHINIIKKAQKIFDVVVIAITFNNEKKNQTDFSTRYKQVCEATKGLSKIKIVVNESKMTYEFAKEMKATCIIRSARNSEDFQYELELAAANKKLGTIDTVIILPDLEDINFESRLIKQRG